MVAFVRFQLLDNSLILIRAFLRGRIWNALNSPYGEIRIKKECKKMFRSSKHLSLQKKRNKQEF